MNRDIGRKTAGSDKHKLSLEKLRAARDKINEAPIDPDFIRFRRANGSVDIWNVRTGRIQATQ